jgi:hypothetical protein
MTMEMGERGLMCNACYQEFEDFRNAVLGFLQPLSEIDHLPQLGRAFSSRTRAKVRTCWIVSFQFFNLIHVYNLKLVVLH